MGVNTVVLPDSFFANRLTRLTMDNFESYVDAQLWTKGATGSGAGVSNVDAPNGPLVLTTGATTNNEAWIASTRKAWIWANNKPFVFESKVNYAEADTNHAGVAVGLCSAPGAGMLVDTTIVPVGTFSGALIYKMTGETVWRCVSSLGTTQTITKSTTTAGGANTQTLRIEGKFVSATILELTFYVDGVLLLDASQTARNVPIKQYVTYTGAVAMAATMFAKVASGVTQLVNISEVAIGITR